MKETQSPRPCLSWIRSSATNIARVYNMTRQPLPAISGISGQVVLDAFFIHALLCDRTIRGSTLAIPHHGLHRDRLEDALMERNLRLAGTGQEMWGHACGSCMKVIDTQDGSENPLRECSLILRSLRENSTSDAAFRNALCRRRRWCHGGARMLLSARLQTSSRATVPSLLPAPCSVTPLLQD